MLVISKSFQFGALFTIVVLALYIYIFALENICIGNSCERVYADEEQREEVEAHIERASPDVLPERYSDPEYLEALETVQKEVDRREEIEEQKQMDSQESLGRATQKAIEMREEKQLSQ